MESDIRSDWLDSAQPFSTTTRSVPFLPSTSSMIIYDGQYKTKATTGEPSVFNLLTHTMRARKSIRLLDILGFSESGVARLGEGATYVVEKKQPVEGGGFVAVKTAKFTVPRGVTQLVAFSSHELRRLKSVLLEVEILAHPPLQAHPNIAKLLGIAWDTDSPGFTPQLVMELATFGSLKTFLEQNSVSEITKRELCHDIACGLDALHQCMIVHGDVKQDNVLIFPHPTRTFTARLSDFEHAVLETNTSHYLGTPIYNAPEVHSLMRENVLVQQSLSLTQLFLCDAFAFGLLVFEIFLNGRRYFELEGGDLLQNRISDNIEETKPGIHDIAIMLLAKQSQLSPNMMATCLDILEQTIQAEPKHRLQQGWGGIKGCLRPNSDKEINIVSSKFGYAPDESGEYSILSFFYGVLNLTSETLGHQIVAELEHTATSNPDPKLMANACFSLCLVFGSGRILTPMLKNEALNWLAKSAILGSKAASLVGRRIFEANECPIPETIESNFDQDPPTETSVHKQSTESQFFAEAVRILLPQKLQSDLRHRFRMAGVTDTAGQMFSWIKEKCDHFQSNDEFIQFANEHLLLHVSIAFQDLETTTFLLGTGCSVNLEGPEGLTPLLVACQCGNKTFVDALLERGADASRTSHNGVTPLHWLILFPVEVMEALVKALTDHEANVNHLMNDFSHVFVDGLGLALEGSPLCWSVLCRNHAAIAALLHWGAGPSVQHCLRHALQLVCADVLEQLISENGALDQLSEDRPSDLWYRIGAEARREFHRWCIHGKAYASAYAATMDVLVRHGMQYPGIPAEYRDSPLSRAVMNCNIPLARELIKRGADISETDPTNGATLLTNLIISDVVEISDTFKKVQMVELLLESGVPTQPPARGMKDPGWSPGFYQTPLSLACSFQATLPVIELLASHCPRHVNDKYGGKTALLSLPGSHSDIEAAEIARLLLSLGADPEIEGDHSPYNTRGNWMCCRRAVDIAVQHKNLKLLEIYLDHGVSPVMGVTGGHSFTVLHTAVFEALCHMQHRSGSQGESRAASFIDCILSYPIPRVNGWIEIADHKGYTPLWYAIYWGLPATVEVLLSHDAVKLSLKHEATMTDVLHFGYEHPPLFVTTGADGDSEAIFYISRYMLPESPAAYTKRLDKIAELLRAEVRL